ncbi:MAG TPA: S-methyl-5'-thioadenosine phosphorylase [Aeromicrobium sp.]|nr:S-methyl-5'-thioadenosine phosphorylase [Aeromicrobium sp.]HKY58767.1 S-methyl-5'-thioadenosine phosphorylase [Aeromicrobium sp.]
MSNPDIAVVGGSGFYSFLTDAETIEIDTPYGAPSGPVSIGEAHGRTVAFLPRHGPGHEFPAHQVPYRANLWALRSLGVRQVLAPCAVGGLTPELGPGTFVVPDQLVDRTTSRIQTFYHSGAVHVTFADPYCHRLRTDLLAGLSALNPVDGGAMVVIEGPRFSTRAESRWYADQGWSVVNMTGHPEAVLARELGLCYATVALVTDHDAGVTHDDGTTSGAVSMEEVFRVFAEHTEALKAAMGSVIANVGPQGDCVCGHAVDGMDLPFELPGR